MSVQLRFGVGLSIGNVPLALYYQTDGTLAGWLDNPEDEPVFLVDTLTAVSDQEGQAINPPKGLAKLSLESLYLRISKQDPTLQFEAKTALTYHISKELKADFGLGIAYKKLKDKTEYLLEGTAFLDWAEVGTLDLKAKFTHEEWSFEGELIQKKVLDLQGLATAMAQSLKVHDAPELPDALKSLHIKKTTLACSSKENEQNLSFYNKSTFKYLDHDFGLELYFDFSAQTGRSVSTEKGKEPTTPPPAGYKITLKGELEIGDHKVKILFNRSKTVPKDEEGSSYGFLLMEYKGGISLSDLLMNLTKVQLGLDLTLDQLTLVYATSTEKGKTESYWLIYVHFDKPQLKLPPIPIFKEVLSQWQFRFDELEVSYLYTKAEKLSTTLRKELGKAIELGEGKAEIRKGLQVRGLFQLVHQPAQGEPQQTPITLFRLGASGEEKKEAQADGADGNGSSTSTAAANKPDVAAEAKPVSSEDKKKNKNKPFQVSNFKAGLKGKNVTVSFDASLNIKALNVKFNQFTLLGPADELMQRKFKKLTVYMQGLELSLNTSQLTIAGGLLRLEPDAKNDIIRHLAGFVKVTTKVFGIGILAEYIEYTDGRFSLLAFGVAKLKIPLFATPIFLTKVALGFGYNYAFEQIPVEALPQNAFMTLMRDSGTPDLKNISQSLSPQVGTHTIMVGAEISGFDPVVLFSARVLLIVDTEKSSLFLLGHGSLDLSAISGGVAIKGAIDMGMVGEINSKGIFVRFALLTGSYLFFEDAELSGSGALMCWYSGQYAGSFLLSMGGYHPFYSAPAHFPNDLERLKLKVKLAEGCYLESAQYLAVTNTALMFGAKMDLKLKIETSLFSARIEAMLQMDAILSWMPFYFKLDILARLSIEIKVGSGWLSKTFKLSTQSKIKVFGPDFGIICSYELRIPFKTILLEFAYGSVDGEEKQLSFNEFKDQVLNDGHFNLRLTGPTHEKDREGQALALLTRNSALTLSSKIPVDHLKEVENTLIKDANAFALAPVSKNKADHSITVKLTGHSGLEKYFDIKHETHRFPAAIWSTKKGASNIKEMNKLAAADKFVEKNRDFHFTVKEQRDEAPYEVLRDGPRVSSIRVEKRGLKPKQKEINISTEELKKNSISSDGKRDYLQENLFELA